MNDRPVIVSADPLNDIRWRDAESLNANNYNPNVVFDPELKLLERSILMTGWVQPVLIASDGTIIDGFHRVMLSRVSTALKAKYHGRVPCAVLDVTRAQAMMLTVRMNRAKGSHVAARMSSIIHELIDVHGCDRQEIAAELGAGMDEIDLLYQDGVFKMKNIEAYRFSSAWYPKEVKKS
jgi:ParB-like chromosome segregation protein Spo0J